MIDCGDRLQGGIIVRKTKEFSVHSWTSWRLECTLSVSTIIEKKERLDYGGSWVQIPSGTRIFFFPSPPQINQYYIFKQIWTKRTTGKLDSSHSGIQIQVRNQFIYQSSSPLDNKILYKLVNVKQFTWSYDCLYKLPPVHQYLYPCCIMNHGINSHERKLQ